jgi:hypothetical protein
LKPIWPSAIFGHFRDQLDLINLFRLPSSLFVPRLSVSFLVLVVFMSLCPSVIFSSFRIRLDQFVSFRSSSFFDLPSFFPAVSDLL